ncbi:hypothetical protein [Pseudoclavibacter sp. VKM Ac-2888]|uniref:hypothetical protein n=1 Tax=Pseudoclavibacter sp. VKM Ac-2888 TaxID=2783830 RepID=UPI00188BD7BD|nr:hypothetical protein [Pseudoclavibacter sp. VKM Ac-2888]MBF4549669.1 hypothetical protein [Pseudoclavibacter sp. VKM Ac-2888]
MSKLNDHANEATREYEDVDVLFDRELLGEQKRLTNKMLKAQEEYALSTQEGYDGDPRFSLQAYTTAKHEFEEFIESIRDKFAVIRVVELPPHEWQAVKALNPLPEDKSKWSVLDHRYGVDAYAATKAALEISALEVDGEEAEKPTPKVWQNVFANIGYGDLTSLVIAQFSVNEVVYSGGYTAAKKG